MVVIVVCVTNAYIRTYLLQTDPTQTISLLVPSLYLQSMQSQPARVHKRGRMECYAPYFRPYLSLQWQQDLLQWLFQLHSHWKPLFVLRIHLENDNLCLQSSR